MTDLYAPLSEDPNDYCFIDSETCSLPHAAGKPEGNIKEVGVDVYHKNCFANIWTYAIGDNDVEIMSLDNGFDERLTWDLDASDDLKRFYERAERGEAWFVAWNAAFDWHIWNGPESDFPPLRDDMMLDAMVQAAAAGLPGKLEHAGHASGFGGKYEQGGKLMPLFANWGAETSLTRPDLWAEYCRYGKDDTALLRDVFFGTQKLPRIDWEDYWVSERINKRGMALDVEFAKRAAAVATANIERVNKALIRATNGQIDKVTQIQRITPWVYDQLDKAEARDIMVKEWDLDDEDDLQPAKLGLDKPRIEALIAYFDNRDELTTAEQAIYEVIGHRLYGGSTSPAKFGKMLRMQSGGVLRNQYVCNGAPQTGRYSSRGVQIHNLMRKTLGELEEPFMELINELELDDG